LAPCWTLTIAHVHIIDPCALLLQDGTGDPVWLQLLEACAEGFDTLHPVLQNLAEQLAKQRALTAQLQQQLSDQNATQQQVISDQAAQLLAQQQVAAEQRAEIAALKAQLQECAGAQQPHAG
jgi:hypothetical protein